MYYPQAVNQSIQNIFKNALSGKYAIFLSNFETNLVEDGVAVFLGENRFTSTEEEVRKTVSVAPNASILIKKKAFSTFKSSNDIRWLDRTERALLRATKALFAFKVAQIRTYEAISKFENFFTEYKQINLQFLVDLINNAKYFDAIESVTELKSNVALDLLQSSVNSALLSIKDDIRNNEKLQQDVLNIFQRTAFSGDLNFTTWFVDPLDVDNFGTGPGTGVIELGTYSSFECSSAVSMDPTSSNFSFNDPYRISYISEEDIELSIEEALFGTLGLFQDLMTGGNRNIYDGISSYAAGFELLGLGALDSTLNVNYIRQQLRKFYLGKSFINCGDGLHIFVRSNRFHANFQSSSNNQGIKEASSFEDYSIDENIIKAEWMLYTNKQIDFDSYKKIRLASPESFGMQHIYGGFVTNISESFDANSGWKTTVRATNNMSWLSWSRYMAEPSLQNSLGVLEDPLTPYEIKVDDTGEVISEKIQLLPENQYLLQQGLLSFNSGILRGQKATQSNIIQGQYSGAGSLYGTKIVQHADGFVYRWKTGIITATAGMAPGGNTKRNDVNSKLLSQNYGLTSAQDILMNLDVANIISLLVVGQPYNIQSFLDQAYQAQTLSKNDFVRSSSNPQDLLSNVIDAIRKQNVYFGAFKPYRMITLSSIAAQSASDGTLSNQKRNESNNKINALRARRAKLEDMIKKLSLSNRNDALINNLKDEVAAIQNSISEEVQLISESSTLDPLVANFNLFGKNKMLPLSGSDALDHEVSKAMSIIGAQRRIEDVRLNRDQNLLIISDQYDQDTDLRPFLLGFKDSNWKLFKGTYLNVYEKCSRAAGVANFEFFCNTQGHLEFRPPLWNRTPLSILKAMMEMQKHNRNIVPDFLKSMLTTRVSSIRRDIHRLNVRIALLALMMKRYPDRDLIPGMLYSGDASLKFFGIKKNAIYSDDLNNKENITDNSAIAKANPSDVFRTGIFAYSPKIKQSALALEFSTKTDGDILFGDTNTILGEFDAVFQEKAGVLTFDQGELTVSGSSSGALSGLKADDVDAIRKIFKKSFGTDPLHDFPESLSEKELITGTVDDNVKKLESFNSFFSKIKQSISNRDSLVYALKRNEEKQKELAEIETLVMDLNVAQSQLDAEAIGKQKTIIDKISEGANYVKSFSDILSGSANEGTVIDHLIENDDRHLLGPGSGRRYIIRDEDIISLSFSEVPPDFCRVDIVGTAPLVDPGANTEDLYYWAGATDFDLWRQYGYKKKDSDKLPYSSSAELQSKPFAIMELQTQRLKINQGSVTVVGNEYYQPGDTVYVADKGLLYYVTSVSHSFSFGGTFTTTLELTFGHAPGEYVPTPMDIIGQQYGIDPLSQNFLVYKDPPVNDRYRCLQPDSSLLFPNVDITESNLNILLGYANNQVRFYNIMTDLSTVTAGQKYVVIRGFVKNEAERANVESRVNIVKSLLMNPVQVSQVDVSNTLIDGIPDAVDYLSEAYNSIAEVGRGLASNASNVRKFFSYASTANLKQTIPMTLPNGLPITKIDESKIIIQITDLSGDKPTTQIQCLNPALTSAITKDGTNLSAANSQTIADQLGLSLGGPKQNSWLDLRKDITAIHKIIEIGVLDLPSV